MNKSAVLASLSLLMIAGTPAALAQSYPVGGAIPVAPVAPSTPIAAPVVVAPTVVNTVSTPVFVAPPVTNTVTDQIFPKDITDVLLPKLINDSKTYNSKGVKEVTGFASNVPVSGGALFRAEEGSHFEQISANEVKLDKGAVLVSLHGPAATIQTNNGTVQVKGEGNVLTSFIAGVMRVANISARGSACQVKIDGKTIEGETKTLALAPGYELVVGDRPLLHGELRPADGLARRANYVFDKGYVATNEFSVDSILLSHPIVASMLENSTKADRKCLNEMCKMASVMNFIHGAGGYKQAEGTGIATKPGANTQ
jgi:hypothetical protein